jgi:hypothetical protein
MGGAGSLGERGDQAVSYTTPWDTIRAAEDAAWQARILDLLQQTPNVPQSHVQALANNVGAIRIKPEEVVAAGLQDDWPASYDDIAQMAQDILAELAA